MARSDKLRIVLEGDLARAISWEAGRQGLSPQAFIERMLGTAAASTVSLWKHLKQEADPDHRKPAMAQMKALKSVLSKAYGPNRKTRPARGPRP